MSCFLAKTFAAILLGLLRWLDCAAGPLGLPPPSAAATALTAGFRFNSGTGFFVSDNGDLISAAHVLGKCGHAVAIGPNGVRFGRQVAVSPGLDIALFRFDEPTPAHATFPSDPFDLLWASSTTVGYRSCGGLKSLRLNDAHAFGGFSRLPDTVVLQAEGLIEGGNSGSPVVDADGTVIGMLLARGVADPRVGYAVDAATLKRFLTASGVTIATRPHRPGLLFARPDAGADAVPYTVAVACVF